jgi:Domain of unknown function (DUF4062)
MKKELANSPTLDQRVIRVFVSSTFKDMQAERDELINLPIFAKRLSKNLCHFR